MKVFTWEVNFFRTLNKRQV